MRGSGWGGVKRSLFAGCFSWRDKYRSSPRPPSRTCVIHINCANQSLPWGEREKIGKIIKKQKTNKQNEKESWPPWGRLSAQPWAFTMWHPTESSIKQHILPGFRTVGQNRKSNHVAAARERLGKRQILFPVPHTKSPTARCRNTAD